VALAAARMAGLRRVAGDQQGVVLAQRPAAVGMDPQHRQDDLPAAPAAARAHPRRGPEEPFCGSGQSSAGHRPAPRCRGQGTRRVAAELIGDLERIYQRKKAANRELSMLLRATGTTLTDLHGIGPSGAARLLAGVGDITRFPARAHFASWNGTAPIGASSGDHLRHRLSRAGNRQINRALHIMAVAGSATTPKAGHTTTAKSPPGRRRWKRCVP
jgi:transposase